MTQYVTYSLHLFNPVPILSPITLRNYFASSGQTHASVEEKVFFTDDAASGKSVWPYIYRLTATQFPMIQRLQQERNLHLHLQQY